MFIPTKHENLKKSTIVLGSDIIKLLKKESYNIEDLYQKLKKQMVDNDVSLNHYYNTLTFLWLTDIIEINNFTIQITKSNVS